MLSEHHDIMTESLSKNCVNSSINVEQICKEIGLKQETFQCSYQLEPGLFHCFDIVNFDLPNGDTKKYLVDCTYRQFFIYKHSFL